MARKRQKPSEAQILARLQAKAIEARKIKALAFLPILAALMASE